MELFLQLIANGIVNGALYAILAIGFGLVWRSLRVFHVAYGGMFVLCAYCFHTLVAGLNLNLYISIVLTLLFAAIIGWLMEIAFYRPFDRKSASSAAVLIASLGIFVVIENVTAIVFGNELQTLSHGIVKTWHIGPVVLTEIQILQFTAGIIVVVTLRTFVQRLKVFKALWAMGDQPELISVLGLPAFLLRSLVLVLSTVLVALSASLIYLDIGTNPHMGMSYLLIAAVAVLVGGVNSYSGWFFGAVILAILQSLVVWKFSTRWMDLLTFALLVAMLVFRPHGLLEREIRVEEAK